MATTLPAGMSISNVEKMTINTSGGLGLAGSTATAAVAQVNTYVFSNATAGGTMTVNYGTLSSSITTAATSASANADLFVAAINAMAGSTIAVNAAGTVTVTAPVAGTALPGITFSGAGAAAEAPTVTLTTANVAASGSNVTAASYDLSGISSLTDITATAAGASDVKVSDTANITLTTTAGAVSITGGKAVTTSGATGAVAITGAAGITSATVTGGTTVTINDNGTETDTLTSATLSGNTGAAAINSDALTTLSLANSNQNATVTAAAATRTLNVTVNKLTGGAITDAQATTLNITSTGTASTGISLSAAKATTVTIAGDKALTSTGETFTVATSITSTNTAGVTLGTELATGVAFTGAAGNDSIKIAATTKAISMGAGDDTVTTSAATIGAGGTVDGGDGTDTISMTTANAATATADATAKAAFADKLSGFERLTLGATAASAEVKLNNLDNINYVNVGDVATGQTLTLSGAATGFTLNANSGTTGTGAVAVALATDGTADVLNVGISNSTAQDLQALTANGFETIAFTSDDTATTPAGGFKHVVSALTATAVKTITVTGDAGFNLGYTGTTATLVDASGITKGAFDWTAGTLAASSVVKGSATGTNTINLDATTTASTFVTYTGGTGNDVIDASSSNNNNVFSLLGGDNSLQSGNGNNTVTLASDAAVAVSNGATGNSITLGNGNNTVTDTGTKGAYVSVGTGSNTITLGSGNDFVTVGAAAGLNVINVGTGTDTVVLGGKQIASGYYTSVTGMSAGDVINLDAVAGGVTTAGALGAKITLGAESNFANYLDAATAGDGGTNAILKWFQYNGNTYLVVDDNAAATFQNADDSVIQLVGLVDLSTATTTTAHVVTLV